VSITNRAKALLAHAGLVQMQRASQGNATRRAWEDPPILPGPWNPHVSCTPLVEELGEDSSAGLLLRVPRSVAGGRSGALEALPSLKWQPCGWAFRRAHPPKQPEEGEVLFDSAAVKWTSLVCMVTFVVAYAFRQELGASKPRWPVIARPAQPGLGPRKQIGAGDWQLRPRLLACAERDLPRRCSRPGRLHCNHLQLARKPDCIA
jgi:hypothetical protein